MESRFARYLEEGTKKIIEIVSTPSFGEEEKSIIIEAFSNELLNSIGNTGNLGDHERLLYGASIKYVDGRISSILSNQNALYDDYENAIKLCQRQRELFGMFQDRNWELPKVDNMSLDRCEQTLRERQELILISRKILEVDRQIDELSRSVQTDLNVKTCDIILNLLSQLEENIVHCEKKSFPFPVINNKDIKKTRNGIIELRKTAEQKETLYQNICDVDHRIHNIISMQKKTNEHWQEIIELCYRQSTLLSECSQKQWPLPSIKYLYPQKVMDKYTHYIEMINLDRWLSSEKDSISSKKQYNKFFDNCLRQWKNIEICRQRAWQIPDLTINDPAALSNSIRTNKRKNDNKKKFKLGLALTGFILLCALILVPYGIYKYREGKVQIPFDSSYVVGKDINDIYHILDEAGFENITEREDNSGWRDSGEVIRVSIDNSNTYSKGDYQKKEVNVVITYSSAERVYVTDILKNWKQTDYESIQKVFKDAGFTNVSLEKVITSEKENDKLIDKILLNKKVYTNEHCFLPLDASIVISYYSLKIGIGNDSLQFIGQDYRTVVAGLKESGFTNIQTQEITTGWTEGNAVVGVTVNNVDTYNSSETFDPDVKIVVKYSSNDRIDVTSIFEGWQTKNYEQLQKSLETKGFNHVIVSEKITDDITKNQLISNITVNNELFTSGDCYLQKTASIALEYYVLKIVIGGTESSFTGEQYSRVVAKLREKGFTNIQLKRADNLITGWITKEGSIKNLSINGNTDFANRDSFYYDAQIVIIVNTFKDKGCEDITVIAE